MMTTNARFTARPPLLAATPARQPLGYAGDNDPEGLADALDAIQSNPPRSMPALGDDLLAEALMQYARRNSADGQASPLAAADAGDGGYGAAQAAAHPDAAGNGASSAPQGWQVGSTSPAIGDPSAAAASMGPRIDQLNLDRSSPQWAALLRQYMPHIGLQAGSGGYAPGG